MTSLSFRINIFDTVISLPNEINLFCLLFFSYQASKSSSGNGPWTTVDILCICRQPILQWSTHTIKCLYSGVTTAFPLVLFVCLFVYLSRALSSSILNLNTSIQIRADANFFYCWLLYWHISNTGNCDDNDFWKDPK